jgi:site-specific DNA recombinase
MGAARRKGKWVGGNPPLGYDTHPDGGRLVINAGEAEHVRGIFALYIDRESLLEVVRELDRRGWRTKRWTTKKGNVRGGNAFEKNTISYLLASATYVGRVLFKGKIYDGEQEAIVDEGTWQTAQKLLERNSRCGGRASRNKHGALLRGLLRCTACDAAMGHTYTEKGSRRYRYYTCQNKQKRGSAACPTGSIPAGEIESFVVDRIRSIGTDPKVQAEVLAQLGTEHDYAVVVEALERFELAWEGLSPTDQTRMINLLVERVGYDAEKGTISITFRPNGIVALSERGAA